MTYVKHQPCPNCGSRDNLAVYTDHEYCFGCKYILFYNYHPRRVSDTKDTGTAIVSLPEDIIPSIPSIADEWLKKYSLTQRELYDNHVVWSEYKKLLIFPYFDDKHFLWGWQGRYFGDNKDHPKWIGKGKFKDRIKVYSPLTRPERTSILIVEDIISTIKTSRIYNSICMYGSFIDISKLCIINREYKPQEFILWHDKDKEKESRLFSVELNKIGLTSRVISTDLDPKEYSTEEIRRIVES